MKNILHVERLYFFGGKKNFIDNILEKSNHHLIILTGFADIDKNESSNRIFYLEKKAKNIFSQLIHLIKLFRKYDLIISHADSLLVFIPLMFTRKKGLLLDHGIMLPEFYFRKKLKQLQICSYQYLTNTTLICSTSISFDQIREKKIYWRKKNTHVIPFGTALKFSVFRKKVSDVLKIGIACRFDKQKRVDWIIKSFEDYTSKISIEILLAGVGSEEKSLIELAKKTENEFIKFIFLGKINNMIDFYSKIDLFVFAGKNETFGLVVLEALTQNVPVVVFDDIGGAKELIRNSINGIILPVGTVNLANFWKKLASTPTIIDRMSNAISHDDLKKYTIEETIKKLESFLD